MARPPGPARDWRRPSPPITSATSRCHGCSCPRCAWRHLLPLFTLFVPNVNRVQTSARRLAELVDRSEGASGEYFSRGRIARSSAQSYDERLAAALWDLSCELAGLPPGIA